jgi:hypothetical protein
VARLKWRTSKTLCWAVALCAGLLVSASCSDTVRQGRSPAYVVIDGLEAAQGMSATIFTNILESDVLTKGSVLEDQGRVTMHLQVKNLDIPATPTNAITVDRYHVSFRRADGRNTPGVDVPYAFDGAATGALTEDGKKLILVFVLVRVQAKLEPPLSPLVGLGGAVVISTIADVTFYGRDQAGNDVSVVGSISVNFADWADPAS